jgi:hypothetical protein
MDHFPYLTVKLPEGIPPVNVETNWKTSIFWMISLGKNPWGKAENFL